MIEAVLHEAKAHKNLLQLLGVTLKKLREKNPHAAGCPCQPGLVIISDD
jgi:hypothetical protein